MSTPPEDRSAMALAMAWAHQGMSISLQMVVPGLIGVWADSRLNTSPIFAITGFGLGLVLGIWSLTRLKAPGLMPREKESPSPKSPPTGAPFPSNDAGKSSLDNGR